MFVRFVLALALGLTLVSTASANADAEKFAQGLIDEGTAILNEGGNSARFHDFIAPQIDARKTALFTLGQYRRGADEQTLSAFVDAFREYAIAIYELRLKQRKSDKLRVVGSIENKPGDITVNATTEGRDGRQPSRVAVRVMGSAGDYKIVDVQVEGAWLSVEQRDQFATFLSKNGGDISALNQHLREQAEHIRA